MIDGLKPYLKYKGSGVPWLGEVPEHWDVRSLGSLTSFRSGRGRTDLPLLSVVREKGVIPRASMSADENHNFVPDDLSNYKVVRAGDLVINKMKAWQGSLGIAPVDGIVSPAYFVLSLDVGHKKYAHSLLRSRPYVDLFARASDGVRIGQWDLSVDAMKRIAVPIPGEGEQSAIVRFLGAMERRIGQYIRSKRKLIALLNEQKQAIIHRVVTRGRNSNVRLRPSGVEWLGDVPAHWKVLSIGRFARVGNGSTPSRGNPSYWNGGKYPWLNSSTVNRSPILTADQFVTARALAECHLPRVQAGSVLVAITGQGKTRGRAAVLAFEATINQHIAFITDRGHNARADYLQLVISAAYDELRRISDDSGSTKGALTCTEISRFKVALPPRQEQENIVAEIALQNAAADDASMQAEKEIALLHEFRTRLIADIVTGKLDVREAAASLPDEEVADEMTEIGDTLEEIEEETEGGRDEVEE